MPCPICDSKELELFLSRNSVPVHQNLLISQQHSAENIERGDLSMVVCNQCGFVFNQSFDANKLSYGEDYENTQSYSDYFLAYMEEYAEWLVEDCGVRNKSIIEVGCGKGAFIKMLVEPERYNNTGNGFDPSYLGPLEQYDGRLKFHKKFYDSSAALIDADVVVCRHVIEHVESPMQLLLSVHSALSNNQGAKVYFETPCVEWIFKNHVMWDLFYEHCSLFSASSLRIAFQRAGFVVNSVKHVFEGQYLLICATMGNSEIQNDNKSYKTRDLAMEYSKQESENISKWNAKILRLSEEGNVAVWGAGAKGNTFVNLVDSGRKYINCMIDVNPNKQGNYVPGTGHPIVGVGELKKRNIKYAIQMNPNYLDENRILVKNEGATTQLIS